MVPKEPQSAKSIPGFPTPKGQQNGEGATGPDNATSKAKEETKANTIRLDLADSPIFRKPTALKVHARLFNCPGVPLARLGKGLASCLCESP